MATQPLTCLICDVPMETGFVIDKADGDLPTVAEWMQGPPETNFVWRLDLGLKTKGRNRLPITALRCPKCGRVDLFAPDKAD
jgi:hypothetical protein